MNQVLKYTCAREPPPSQSNKTSLAADESHQLIPEQTPAFSSQKLRIPRFEGVPIFKVGPILSSRPCGLSLFLLLASVVVVTFYAEKKMAADAPMF